MSIREIDETLARVKSKGGRFRSSPSEDPQLVLSVETGLGIVFPGSFVEFYQNYRYLQIRSDEFMQIGCLANVYQTQQDTRRQKACLFPVLEDGMGGWWYVVCTRKGENEPSDFGRIIYNPGCDLNNFEDASSDFIRFVVLRIERWEATL